jgi:hypothetical protein
MDREAPLPPLPDVAPDWTAAAEHARQLGLAGVREGLRRRERGRDQSSSVCSSALTRSSRPCREPTQTRATP